MVHGLATLRKLNDDAVAKANHNGHGTGFRNGFRIPKEIETNAAAIRRFINRPWTAAELHGKKSVFETYAESNAATFKGAAVQAEALRN